MERRAAAHFAVNSVNLNAIKECYVGYYFLFLGFFLGSFMYLRTVFALQSAARSRPLGQPDPIAGFCRLLA